jgi:G1/S-specific cyclin-E1
MPNLAFLALHKKFGLTMLGFMFQVCEVYKMHRETFYMGIDYLDRYLSRTNGVKKSQLQLVGITSLFIAAKMEVCQCIFFLLF